jgi:hypothetical protein
MNKGTGAPCTAVVGAHGRKCNSAFSVIHPAGNPSTQNGSSSWKPQQPKKLQQPYLVEPLRFLQVFLSLLVVGFGSVNTVLS